MTVVASRYAPQPNQLYETPEWATEVLFRNRYLISPDPEVSIWEPSAGNHKMADVIRNHKDSVVTSDIVEYSKPHDIIYDFLIPDNPVPVNADWIITNPPYGAGNRLAVQYANLALQRAPNVALLLTAKFDFGKTRTNLFRDNPRFWGKIVLMDRLSFFDGKTGTEDHAWYIWRENKNPMQQPIIIYMGMENE